MFFPDTYDHPARAAALALCAQCPVITECADYAITRGVAHGIWGGTTGRQRQNDPRWGVSRPPDRRNRAVNDGRRGVRIPEPAGAG